MGDIPSKLGVFLGCIYFRAKATSVVIYSFENSRFSEYVTLPLTKARKSMGPTVSKALNMFWK